MPRKRRPRQADVAKMAGVSQTTVSVVLNDRAGESVRVSQETRDRIFDAARKLGYVPDPVARSLAGGQNCLLGIFTYETIFPLKYHDFYYPFLVGIEEEAEAQGYDLLLFTSVSTVNGKRRIYRENTNRLRLADGAVLLGLDADRGELARLLDEEFPFVFVGRREVPDGLSYAAADYAAGTADVVAHLVEWGHRRIAYVGVPDPAEPQQDREAGYYISHQSLGLPFDPRLVLRITPEALTDDCLCVCLADGVTAFVVEDDTHAQRMLAMAEALGKQIPQDLSIALLGDAFRANAPTKGMTSFKIPRREMGAHAVRLIARMLSHPDEPGPYRVTLPCTFLPGNSVAAPRAHRTQRT